MKDTLKQINELTDRFYPFGEAKIVATELYEADKLAQIAAAPLPSEELLSRIKADIGVELDKKRLGASRWALTALALAACVAIVVAVAIRMQTGSTLPAMPKSPVATSLATDGELAVMAWDGQGYVAEDINVAIDSIELALYGRSSNQPELDSRLTTIENQLSELQEPFWKG